MQTLPPVLAVLVQHNLIKGDNNTCIISVNKFLHNITRRANIYTHM